MLSFKWEYDHQGRRSGTLVGRRFFVPFLYASRSISLGSPVEKGYSPKNHKDNPLIPACEEINWDCGAEQPMLMSFQLLWTSTAPTVFHLLNTKRKEQKSARFLLGFFIGFESFQKKALFKLLTTNPPLIFDLCTKMEFISAPLIVWFEEMRAGGGIADTAGICITKAMNRPLAALQRRPPSLA